MKFSKKNLIENCENFEYRFFTTSFFDVSRYSECVGESGRMFFVYILPPSWVCLHFLSPTLSNPADFCLQTISGSMADIALEKDVNKVST